MDVLVDLVTGVATGPHGLDDLVRGGAPSSWWRSSFAETRLVAGVHPEHIERPRVLRTPRGHAHRHRPVLPIIRTFAQVVAGVGQMEHRWFVFYNIAGGVAWGASMTWGGYLLGQAVLPLEFHVFGIRPEPWKPADSVGWLLVMAWDLSANWRTELARLRYGTRLGRERAAEFIPPYPGDTHPPLPDFKARGI